MKKGMKKVRVHPIRGLMGNSYQFRKVSLFLNKKYTPILMQTATRFFVHKCRLRLFHMHGDQKNELFRSFELYDEGNLGILFRCNHETERLKKCRHTIALRFICGAVFLILNRMVAH